MSKFISRWGLPIAVFLIGVGVDVSGVQNPALAIALFVLAGLLVIPVVWEFIRRMLSGKAQFYEGRNDPRRPTIESLIERFPVIWVATHTAGNLRNRDLLREPIARLILLDPKGQAVESLGRITLNRDAGDLRGEISQSLEMANKNKVPVKLFDGPLTSIIIGNPESRTDGWLQIESYFPWSAANERPSICFDQKDFPNCFEDMVKTFKKMWNAAT